MLTRAQVLCWRLLLRIGQNRNLDSSLPSFIRCPSYYLPIPGRHFGHILVRNSVQDPQTPFSNQKLFSFPSSFSPAHLSWTVALVEATSPIKNHNRIETRTVQDSGREKRLSFSISISYKPKGKQSRQQKCHLTTMLQELDSIPDSGEHPPSLLHQSKLLDTPI